MVLTAILNVVLDFALQFQPYISKTGRRGTRTFIRCGLVSYLIAAFDPCAGPLKLKVNLWQGSFSVFNVRVDPTNLSSLILRLCDQAADFPFCPEYECV